MILILIVRTVRSTFFGGSETLPTDCLLIGFIFFSSTQLGLSNIFVSNVVSQK